MTRFEWVIYVFFRLTRYTQQRINDATKIYAGRDTTQNQYRKANQQYEFDNFLTV